MCGIAGFIGLGNEGILSRMIERIAYRGPDDRGLILKDNVGLAHARLSIIDLSAAGHQPMSNADGTVWMVFNGEIYNFQELRSELSKTGKYHFKSQTDTEVALCLYEEFGFSFLEKLDGMFAIALYDFNEKKLLLARDKVGKKPLYWSQCDDTLVFGSEMKSVLAHPLIKKEINNAAVFQYFSFDYVPEPATIFKNINKLENGSFLIFDGSEIKIKRYFSFKVVKKEIDFDESLKITEDLLSNAVKKRLVADVPVGVFLSGGIDSSTVAYFARQHKKDIITVSIGFDEPTFDESIHAKEVARFLKTEHYHKKFSATSLIEILPEIWKNLDEPFGDSSLLPTFVLSKFAREHFTVALGGDGGDEVFMGYPNHRVQKIAYFSGLAKLTPRGDYGTLLERILPVSDKNLSFFYKAVRYAHSLEFPGMYRDFLNIGAYTRRLERLFTFETKKNQLFDFAGLFLDEYKNARYLEKINLLFLKYYLSDDILFKVDRASMYNGLEVRAPLLDHKVIDFANSLPLNYKLRGLEGKYLLKKIMETKLPRHIVYRRKKGVGVPLSAWLKKDLKAFAVDVLDPKKISRYDLIRPAEAEKALAEHFSGRRDNHKIIWNLIVFQKWCENYL